MSPPGFPNAVVTSTQKEVQQRLLDCVSSFALSSKPTFSGFSEDFWKPLDTKSGLCLNFGAELEMERNEELNRKTEFWKQIMEDNMSKELSEEAFTTLYDKIAIER